VVGIFDPFLKEVLPAPTHIRVLTKLSWKPASSGVVTGREKFNPGCGGREIENAATAIG
jgi:hypothetical protein